MGTKNLSEAIEISKNEFITKLPSHLEKLKQIMKANSQIQKRDVKIEDISSLVRELHNIKSVAGSYSLDFICSGARNIIDHTSYVFDLEGQDIVDLDLNCKIIELIVDYTQKFAQHDSTVHQSRLDSLITKKKTKKRVLVVEKDEVLKNHLKTVFDEKLFSYSFVNSGIEAFNIILDEKFDLLITDLHVGKLDGPSLIAANRISNSINKDIKTVMLSVSYFDLLPSLSMPDFFISKNEQILEELRKVLKKVSEEHDKTNEKEIDILALDDDSNIHDLLKISFSSHKITYRSALNGSEFKKKFSKQKPDIVLLDLILENESGVEVIKEIKKSSTHFDVPVIVLTSLDGHLRSELLSEIPFIIGSLSKPFTPKSMAHDVINLVRQNQRLLRS